MMREEVAPSRIIEAFSAYMDHGGHRVSRAQFEQNMEEKLRDPQLTADIGPLLATGWSWDLKSAAERVSSELIQLLPGGPWKGEGGCKD